MNTVIPGGSDPTAKDATQAVTDYGSESVTESASFALASTGITPEIIAVIAEAATAFVGKHVRILSVKILSQSSQDSRSWADKGRDIVHASHNLVQRGH
jgi:hypothetical protein